MKAVLRCGLLIGTLTGSAWAGTIVDFNSFSPQDTCLGTVSTGGLDFTFNGDTCMGVWTGSPNGNGTPDLVFGYNGYVAITQTGGGAFNLNSFDMAISWYSAATSTTVDVTALFAGGGSSMQTLTLIDAEQLYSLNLTDVTEVDVSGLASADGYWEMDNVNFDSVPEPGSAGLCAAAMLLLGVAVYARKASIASGGR